MGFDIKVLVIDDDTVSRKVAKSLLKKIGFTNCLDAENGQLGWDAIMGNEDIELILCDLFMPVMNGLELLEKVKADPEKSTIPFIMVTAADQTDQIVKIIKAGVNSYIVKPYSVETMKKQVYKTLSIDQ